MRSIAPSAVRGSVAAPPSKSVLQRALAAATLAPGTSVLRASALCDDARAALRAAKALGATVILEGDRIAITGGAAAGTTRIDCGESGLCLRMFAPLAALAGHPIELTAQGSLARRPVSMIEGPLTALGAVCRTADGRPPVRVQGPLLGGSAVVDGTISSQLLTGLLIALPAARADSWLEVGGLKSKPYVSLTLELLARFGVTVDHDAALSRFGVRGGQRFAPCDLAVEGDWSGAAFLLVAGALAGAVEVRDLEPRSLQADRRILVALERAGARCTVARDRVTVERAALRGFELDATHCPDLFPPLVALAAGCRGATRLTGVSRLRAKESDRAAALAATLGRLGVTLRMEGDQLIIEGGPVRGGRIEAHGDHRIAMAAAVAALRAADPVEVVGASCVSKSYPDFFGDLASLGARVS
jgi:3-phosphoshikimate 1-carboxyvinyltransferase